jgi:phage protein D
LTGVTASWHDRGAAKKKTVTVGKADGARSLSRTYANAADATAAATAESSRAARQPRTLALNLALGRADIKPEQPVTVAGFKPAIEAQRWVVAELAHALGDHGFTRQLKLETA